MNHARDRFLSNRIKKDEFTIQEKKEDDQLRDYEEMAVRWVLILLKSFDVIMDYLLCQCEKGNNKQ